MASWYLPSVIPWTFSLEAPVEVAVMFSTSPMMGLSTVHMPEPTP